MHDAIIANMQSSDILRQLQERTGMNAAELAQSTGLSESLISRALNGRNDPAFGKIANAVERLGYRLTLTPLEQTTMSLCDLHLDDLITTINACAHLDNGESWGPISARLRELLEFTAVTSDGENHPIDLSEALQRMPDARWRAFMAGLYKHQQWPNKQNLNESALRLPDQWTPLRKIYRSSTKPDPDFLLYNVYLPQGELQWK